MQNETLNALIKTNLIIFLLALLMGSFELIHHMLTHFYNDIQCEYHYIFLAIRHKTQHIGSLRYYMVAFILLLSYSLFFQKKNTNHVVLFVNVMIFLLLGCLTHDIFMRTPINTFSHFVSHFFNGSFLLTAFNFLMVILITRFTVQKMLTFLLCACVGFLINIIAFLLYFLVYEFLFGATAVYVFIFLFIFAIFQFNIIMICSYLRRFSDKDLAIKSV